MTHGDDSKTFKSLASTLAQDSKPSDKARMDKKKKHHRNKRDSKEPKDYFTPVFEINKAEVSGGGQRKKKKKDLSGVTCFNYNKKGHFSNRCPKSAKKLVLVSATSTSMTGARKEALECVLCIHYPVQFKDTDKTPVQASINFRSEINAI